MPSSASSNRTSRACACPTPPTRLPQAVQAFLGGRNTRGDVYAYDWAYRLTDVRYDTTNPLQEVQTPGSQGFVKNVQYVMDGLGNRSQVLTTPPTPPGQVVYATDVVNAYTQVGGVNRTHDLNGNLADDGTYLFAYDFENRLVEVRLKATQALVASYRYDALGRRVEKAVAGGATTRYVLDGVQVVEEFDGNDAWQARYVYEDGIDRPRVMDRADIADVDGDQNTAEVFRFAYHQQALGSVTEITEPGGTIVEWVTYDVYGQPTIRDSQGNVASQSPVGNPYLFTGREYDPEAGLYFYRARTYDPGTGRFLQRDPLGYVDGLGLLEYCGSAPATKVDAYGTDDRPVATGSPDGEPGGEANPAEEPKAESAQDAAERREDEKEEAKENIRQALDVIAKHGPQWARDLLARLRNKIDAYGLHDMTGARGVCRRLPDGSGGFGYLVPIAIGGTSGKALLEKGWQSLIETLLHELRHVYLYDKGKQPSGTNEEKHPMVPEHGMPKEPTKDDPKTEDKNEAKSNTDEWRDLQEKEAEATVKEAERVAAESGGKVTTPWKPGEAKTPGGSK